MNKKTHEVCGTCKHYKPVKVYKNEKFFEESSEGVCDTMKTEIILNFFEPACISDYIRRENK